MRNRLLPMLIDGKIGIKQWEEMDKDGIERLAEEIFSHYKKMGFPYYKFSAEEKLKKFKGLKDFLNLKGDDIINNSVIKMTMHGLSLAWSYFPHSWEVRCNNMKTPMEAFSDDILFKKVIKKRIKRGTYFSLSGIRKALRSYSGVQSVSNFRPTAAGAIYKRYCKNNSIVWDMSCGYGGRLLGAIASEVVGKYIGNEPCKKTFDGLSSIKNDFGQNTEIEISQLGSEEHFPKEESVDFCFTSPPYFNTEKYSQEEAQSYIKYKTKEEWKTGFLEKTISNCMRALKKGGLLGINVANVKAYKNLEQDTLDICKIIGFKHIETLKLLLSSISKGGYKNEPIFVFQK